MLYAGWRWEKLDVGDGPPICDQDSPDYAFHLAYDPNIEKLVLTYWNETVDRADTWLFDGSSWAFECRHQASENQSSSEFNGNQLFYDHINKVLIDVREDWCTPNPILCGLLCRQDENNCWDCFLHTTPTFTTTYDTHRKRAVMLNGPLHLIEEWDGYQLHEVQLDIPINAEAMAAYDEFSKRVIILSHRGTLEYDGTNLEVYDQITPDEAVDGVWPVAYNPHFEGVVTAFMPDDTHTYVYKNHKWLRIPMVRGDLYGQYSFAYDSMVYFPPTDQFLLLTVPWIDNDGCLAFYELKEVDRTHSRPFDGP